MTGPIYFDLESAHNGTARDWNHRGAGMWRANARRFAAEHGAAGVWRADDSFVLFYRDHDGAVRQKTWRHGRPTSLRN